MDAIQRIWDLIDGKKTYIGIAAASLFATAVVQGWIDPETTFWQMAAIAISAWTGVALGHKASKIQAAIPAVKDLPQPLTLTALGPPARVTDRVAIHEGDRCDQCGHAFRVGDALYQRVAGGPRVVCAGCNRSGDLYVGRIAQFDGPTIHRDPPPALPPRKTTGSGFDPGMN
jgi:hypothetical protein